MTARKLLRIFSLSLLVAANMQLPSVAQTTKRPPNFILIFIDDLGYGDVGVFGAKGYQTPNLDRMAREGIRLTSFYVAQPVCTASRAALLTGSYSNRVGLGGVVFPASKIGLNASEVTLPEILKRRGYATGMFGKWHLGDAPQFLPTHHGFDEYLGIPYSNDMWPPNSRNYKFPPLPLIEGEKAVKEVTAEDQANSTTLMTQRSVSFIERHLDKPFFLYVAHPMPHVPLFVSEKFKGKTKRGLYGDVVEELDWSVGQILDAVKRNGLDQNTLVIFTSDKGPWIQFGDHGGSAGPFRGGKHTAFEGGVREPFIASWPGHIPPGAVNNQPMMTIDLLPTLAHLAGAEPPKDRIIDGRDIWPWLSGKQKTGEPHEVLYFYAGTSGTELHAVRAGKWKMHLPHPWVEAVPGNGGQPGQYRPRQIELSLFDLENDPGETKNVAAEHREVVQQLMKFVERAREDLGDSLTKVEGKNVRPPGQVATSSTAQR